MEGQNRRSDMSSTRTELQSWNEHKTRKASSTHQEASRSGGGSTHKHPSTELTTLLLAPTRNEKSTVFIIIRDLNKNVFQAAANLAEEIRRKVDHHGPTVWKIYSTRGRCVIQSEVMTLIYWSY